VSAAATVLHHLRHHQEKLQRPKNTCISGSSSTRRECSTTDEPVPAAAPTSDAPAKKGKKISVAPMKTSTLPKLPQRLYRNQHVPEPTLATFVPKLVPKVPFERAEEKAEGVESTSAATLQRRRCRLHRGRRHRRGGGGGEWDPSCSDCAFGGQATNPASGLEVKAAPAETAAIPTEPPVVGIGSISISMYPPPPGPPCSWPYNASVPVSAPPE